MISESSNIMVQNATLIDGNPIMEILIVFQVELRWKPQLDESLRALYSPGYRERLDSSTKAAVPNMVEIRSSL